MYDREQAIATLLDDDMAMDPHELRKEFKRMLANGFAGYENMSDEELMQELSDRDISYLFGEDDDEEVQRLKDEKNGLY